MSKPYASNLATSRSCTRQPYTLDKSISTVPTILHQSGSFCQAWGNSIIVRCVEESSEFCKLSY